MDAMVTGEVRKSNFSTGVSAIRRSWSSLTVLPWLGVDSFADAIPVPATAAAAAPWMNRRREVGMAGYGTLPGAQPHDFLDTSRSLLYHRVVEDPRRLRRGQYRTFKY